MDIFSWENFCFVAANKKSLFTGRDLLSVAGSEAPEPWDVDVGWSHSSDAKYAYAGC